MGVLHLAQGRLEEAENALREALLRDPDLAEIHSNLGGIMVRLGKLEPALPHFDRALHLKPDLVAALAGDGRANVVVAGSASERELVHRVVEGTAGAGNVRAIRGLGLEEYIGMLSLARAVVAPSTGPVHIAAALGVPRVAGIYSPVPAHHPHRWGPLGTVGALTRMVCCPAVGLGMNTISTGLR